MKPGVTASSVAVPVAKKAKVKPGAKKLKVKHVNIPKVFAQRASKSMLRLCCDENRLKRFTPLMHSSGTWAMSLQSQFEKIWLRSQFLHNPLGTVSSRWSGEAVQDGTYACVVAWPAARAKATIVTRQHSPGCAP